MDKTTELASGYTVQMYLDDIKELDATTPPNDAAVKSRIADFFVRRFTERYITPINAAERNKKHGFCTMAVSCLMIEALQCFWTGEPDTRGREDTTQKSKGQLAFENFFARTPALYEFSTSTFYRDIRCGILHQAETKGGWTINRQNANGKVKDGFSIDATMFHQFVEDALKDHAESLRNQDKTSHVWKYFREKMGHVCENC